MAGISTPTVPNAGRRSVIPTMRGIARPEKIIGTNTIGAMQAGIYYGYAGLIEGIVSRIKAEHGSPMKVIATGGLASLYAKACPVIEQLEPDLTIHGLKALYEMNT